MTVYANRKHLFWAALVLILMAGLGLYTWLNKEVTLVVDGRHIKTHTFKRTVGEVITEEHIKIGPVDKVYPGLNELVDEGTCIRVIRAFPVQVVAAGKTYLVQTTPARVSDILARAGVKPGRQDVIQPSRDQMIKQAQTVKVIKVTSGLVERTSVLPYQTERTSDPTLEKGLQRTLTKGKNGLARQTIRVTYYDGVPVKQEVIENRVINRPVNQVVAMGSITSVSRGALRFNFREARFMQATAYTYTGHHTASGLHPAVGLVAVDPGVIPMGSRLYIEGYGFARAADRGSSIRGDRLDVFLETAEECRRWGVRKVKVYLLE